MTTKHSRPIQAALCFLTVLLATVATAGAAPTRPAAKANTATDRDEMVLIPAGKFIFGKGDKKTEIDLPAFTIDKYEVTNRQYAKFNLDHRYDPGMDNLPVTMVSQIDARTHCEALDKRLPTEQEWEKAARGSDGRIYPWGNKFDAAAAVTSETEFGAYPPHPLQGGSRKKGKSPFGVMDMSGNVWEWTNSNEGRYFVLKGGSFFEDRDFATASSRLLSIPNDSKDYVGFRCVRSAK
jgi:formylglycine-generating enzyme required for sulfatase activity